MGGGVPCAPGLSSRSNRGEHLLHQDSKLVPLESDALAAYDWLSAHEPHKALAVFGYSLGTVLAVHVAANRPAAALDPIELVVGAGIGASFGLQFGTALATKVSNSPVGQKDVFE